MSPVSLPSYPTFFPPSSNLSFAWESLPTFDQLPSCESTPQGCAWHLFDQENATDFYGTLNFLTEEVIQNASRDITQGISISLNWELDGLKRSSSGRRPLNHTFVSLKDAGLGEFGWDDELSFNTQISSHWDSPCHFPHQSSGLSYNGINCTEELIEKAGEGATELHTQDTWQLRGGVVGRGVLLDYAAYAKSKGLEFSPLQYHTITVQGLEDVAAFQKVDLRLGDVLVVRNGFMETVSKLSPEDQLIATSRDNIGLEPSRDLARRVWDHRFAAVARDNLALEVISLTPDANAEFPSLRKLPTRENHAVANQEKPLHHWFLIMFGLPIGELWYLEKLSEHRRKSGKYSFFLTSIPLNVPGLIAGPPNALAVF